MNAVVAQTHACPKCGHDVPANAMTCPHCREVLTDGEQLLAPLRAIKRKLFMASGMLFILAGTLFLFGTSGADWPVLASLGIGLMACVILALALAV